MVWKQENPALWSCKYAGWTIYKMLLQRDPKGKEVYSFTANKPGQKALACSTWLGMKRKLKTVQLTLF